MTAHAILDIELNDAAFKAFKAKFDEYQSQLKELPAEWAKVSETMAGLSTIMESMDSKLGAGAGHSLIIGKAAISTNKIVGDCAILWTGVQKSSHFFLHDIIGATQSLTKWTALTGVFAGLLGAGGLFGISRMAQHAAGQRQSALGLGVTTGEYASFLTNAGRLTGNPGGLLSKFSEGFFGGGARNDFKAAFGSGIEGRMQGKDAASFFADILPDLKRKLDNVPDNQLGNYLKSSHLENRGIDTEVARRIKAMSTQEIGGISERLTRDATSMNMPDEATKKLQDFDTRLDETWKILKTDIENHLTKLTPSLTKLANSFGKFAGKALEKGSAFDIAMKEVSGGIDWLTGEFETADGRKRMIKFGEDSVAAGIAVELIAKVIAGAMGVAAVAGVVGAARAAGAGVMRAGAAALAPVAGFVGTVAPGLAAGAAGAVAAGVVTATPLNAGEDERARQKKYNQAPRGTGASLPAARGGTTTPGTRTDQQTTGRHPGGLTSGGAIPNIPTTGGAAARADSVSGMNADFHSRLAAMMRDAPAGASVFSGYRSQALQDRLFAHSDRSGHMVARHSHHTRGDAADLKGDLTWFHKHAGEYGLKFPMSYENWHIQSDPSTKVPVPQFEGGHQSGNARPRHYAAIGRHPAHTQRHEEIEIINYAGFPISVG
jgi:hypothetical protein